MKRSLLLLFFMVFLYIVGVYLIFLFKWYTIAFGVLFIWFGLLQIDSLVYNIKFFLMLKNIEQLVRLLNKENRIDEVTQKINEAFHTKSLQELKDEIKYGK